MSCRFREAADEAESWTVAAYPLRQIVVSTLAGVISGSAAPGVHPMSGIVTPPALPEWQSVGIGPTGTAAGEGVDALLLVAAVWAGPCGASILAARPSAGVNNRVMTTETTPSCGPGPDATSR